MIIYLMGYMASGKTTTGELLAKALRYTFMDVDNVFEKENACTIAEFFEHFLRQNGAERFGGIQLVVLQSDDSIGGSQGLHEDPGSADEVLGLLQRPCVVVQGGVLQNTQA